MREALHYLLSFSKIKAALLRARTALPLRQRRLSTFLGKSQEFHGLLKSKPDLYWFIRSGNDPKDKAGAGAQAVEEITVFFWPSHTLMPFLVAGLQLVTSSKGGFFISEWSAAAWRLSKAVLSRSCLKLPEPTDYLPATGICLPWPIFACLYHGRLPSPRGKCSTRRESLPREEEEGGPQFR